MISISNDLAPLNDDFEIIEDDYSTYTGLISRLKKIKTLMGYIFSCFEFFRSVCNFFYKLYKILASLTYILFFIFCFVIVGFLIYYGLKFLYFLLEKMYQYYKNKKNQAETRYFENNISNINPSTDTPTQINNVIVPIRKNKGKNTNN